MYATQIARTLKPRLGIPNRSTMRACTVRDVLEAVMLTDRAKKRVRVYMRYCPDGVFGDD